MKLMWPPVKMSLTPLAYVNYSPKVLFFKKITEDKMYSLKKVNNNSLGERTVTVNVFNFDN